MKDRAKFTKSEHEKPNFFSDSNYFASSSDLPCKKHPLNSSYVGICAYCLTEKLIDLVCSNCGEQLITSCSCSDMSSYRNSSCNLGVRSVGRLSFLIENEKKQSGTEDEQKTTLFTDMKMKQSGTEDDVLLKRSNSCVDELKKNNGFWKIGKLFKKKKEKEDFGERNRGGFDQKFEVCGMDVSRSISVSSFIDADLLHDEGSIACSSAKISDFDGFESRKSGFKGGLIDLQCGFAEKEYDFSKLDDDDDEFIDLKIDFCSNSKTESSVLKKFDQPEGGDIGSSSCRIMVNERGMKKVKNSHMKAWKWVFNHHSGKNDLDHILEY